MFHIDIFLTERPPLKIRPVKIQRANQKAVFKTHRTNFQMLINELLLFYCLLDLLDKCHILF